MNDNMWPPNCYGNLHAHRELRTMMMRGDMLDTFFNIDAEGYFTIRVRSIRHIAPVEYQLSTEGFAWIMTYLMHGFTDDSQINPLQPIHGEGCTGDEYRKQMLMIIMDELSYPDFQKEPSAMFLRYGKPAYCLRFSGGIIHFFFMHDDDGVTEYLRSKKLI